MARATVRSCWERPCAPIATSGSTPPRRSRQRTNSGPRGRSLHFEESYPPDHVEEYVHRSLESAGLESFDLIQFHTWEDDWLRDDRWLYKLDDLRSQQLINAIGISLNRWEPWNGVRAVRTGQIDSVQVIYNIFDQNPEDDLFPACEEMKTAVIARVPFDEGTLTGTLTKESKWPEGDWRNTYFVPDNLIPSVERADALKELLRKWNQEHSGEPEITLPELALRFILYEPHRQHDYPGHAQAVSRGSKHRRQRCRPAACGVIPTTQAAPLGAQTHALVAVTFRFLECGDLSPLWSAATCRRFP